MQVARTAPDDVLTSAIIPVQPLVDFLTLRAKNDLRKSVIGAEPAFPAVLGAPPRHFLLHPHEYILRDDRLMVVLNVVLRQSAVVLATLLVQESRTTGTAKAAWKLDSRGLPVYSALTDLWNGMQKTTNGRRCMNNVEIPCKEPEHRGVGA